MKIKNELEKLKSEFMSLNTDAEIEDFRKKIKSSIDSKTDDELKELSNALVEDAQQAIDRASNVYNYVNVKQKLGSILDIISMSYIAENYFKKSRAWLSQRVNGHYVNGVPVAFTDKELEILSSALDDISTQLHKTARSIA
ncbi:MAG: DUF5053 domain-containing protein [Dysgonamonadaceae bacterium]|jgi:hypothetical protein|nr:DUF5053 domain-containing protein [Dysgonamonadaceae bacterium]